jgi:hypothetical protein
MCWLLIEKITRNFLYYIGINFRLFPGIYCINNTSFDSIILQWLADEEN